MFIFNILLFIIVLGLIIFIHELGHYYFARKAGILVHEFSLGMGPLVYGKRKNDILYAIRAIPIGGYVSMAGESISDAMIKKGDHLSLMMDEKGIVLKIILDPNQFESISGEVISFDLYGKNGKQLFIELQVDDQNIRYEVSRDASYILSKDKYMLVTPEEKSFESKTLLERFLVIFAGPAMNFILAFVLYLIVGLFLMQPNLESNAIGGVAVGAPADLIGLVEGDRITGINDDVINTWDDLSQSLSELDSHMINLTYVRNNEIMTINDVELAVIIQTAGLSNVTEDGDILTNPNPGQVFGRALEAGLNTYDVIYQLSQGDVVVEVEDWDDIISFFKVVTSGEITIDYYQNGSNLNTMTYTLISEDALNKLGYQGLIFQLGISPTESYELGSSLLHPFKMISNNVSQVFATLGLLFNPNEDIGLGDLSGPIGIFTLVSRTSSQGLLAIISFTAFLSINIGLLNLLPIPALDGGRLVFLGIEAVTRKPLSRKLENSINNIMFYLLLGLFVFVTYNDILRIVRGLI
jgi:regulator of sigma E protease